MIYKKTTKKQKQKQKMNIRVLIDNNAVNQEFHIGSGTGVRLIALAIGRYWVH